MTRSWIFEESLRIKPPPIPKIKTKPRIVYHIDRTVSGLLRCASPAVALNRAGLAEAKTSDDMSAAELQTCLDWCDILVLQRPSIIGLISVCQAVQDNDGAAVVEIDDHVKAFPGIASSRVRQFWAGGALNSLLRVMQEADAVLTTTERLADFYHRETGTPCYYVRQQIDATNPRWDFKLRKFHKDSICLGWLMGHTHTPDLELIREPLASILEENPHVRLKCVGLIPDWAYKLPGRVDIIKGEVGPLDYPMRMADFDVGLTPLVDNEFNSVGKSSLKFLEYTMAGAATAASAVGEYLIDIDNRRNGILLADDEWYAGLSYLVKNPVEIVRMHREALTDVLRDRTFSRNVVNWHRTFVAIHTARKSGKAKFGLQSSLWIPSRN